MFPPAEAVININLKEMTENVLKTLTPREEKVIKMRFGLDNGSDHTLEEVGQNFAVTRERIRQIEAKALGNCATPREVASCVHSLMAQVRIDFTPVPLFLEDHSTNKTGGAIFSPPFRAHSSVG